MICEKISSLLPALLSLGVCLLSPVDSYLRYFLPIVAMAIPLAALAAHPPMAETGGAR